MIQKLKQKLKEKKGMSTIEFVLCMVIFVIVTAFIIDVLVISYQHYIISANCTKTARVIAIQGGIAQEIPDNYPGGQGNYMSNIEFRKYLNELAETVQSRTGEFKVYLDYSYIDNFDNIIENKDILVYHYKNNRNGNVSKSYFPQDFVLPYGSFITLRMEYTFEFFYMNNYHGTSDGYKFHSSKSCVTEYVSYDYGYHVQGQSILAPMVDAPTLDPIVGNQTSAIDSKYLNVTGNAITGFSPEGLAALERGEILNLELPTNVNGTIITRIADNAFAGTTQLISVKIPSNIKHIGANAFKDCKNIVSITYFEGLERIDSYAFAGCEKLKQFTPAYGYKDPNANIPRMILPNSLQEIHDYAFEGCVTLSVVRMGENIVKISETAFDKTNISKIHIYKPQGSLLNAPWKLVTPAGDPVILDENVFVYWNSKRTN